MIGRVQHDPQRLRKGLLRTPGPVICDTETTGLNVRNNRILSYGFRFPVGGQYETHILFTERCIQADIQPHITPDAMIREALSVLDRPGQVLVGHNLAYDIQMLRKEGFDYQGETRDTMGLLRLIDQDRLRSADQAGRRILAAPLSRAWASYRLKDAAPHLLGIKPEYTPARNMQTVSYDTHARYLACDLGCTDRLYRLLWRQMTRQMQRYYCDVQSSLTHILADMRWDGVAGDAKFIDQESDRLEELATKISTQHEQDHDIKLVGMANSDFRTLIYDKYRVPLRRGRKKSVSVEVLANLIEKTSGSVQASLKTIIEFRQATSLLFNLRKYGPERGGRFHSEFSAKQASGRLSSTRPNMQQIANTKVIAGEEFRCRDMAIASPGHVLVAPDVAQADVRVMAHEIDRCMETTAEHRNRLHYERFARLPHAANLWMGRYDFINPNWQGKAAEPPPEFEPNAPSPLIDLFAQRGDFYSLVASKVTGTTIARNDLQRKLWKTILLSRINGKGAKSLANDEGWGEELAKQYVANFSDAFPDITSWIALQQQQVALTGKTFTWRGRYRRDTAHYWMVSQHRVRVMLRYKSGSRRWIYWFDVEPIRPSQRNLLCFIHRIWNTKDENGPKTPRLIYDANRGRIGNKYYRHIDEIDRFMLPYRNLPWSNIRYVQKLDASGQPVERAAYDGLDTTCRRLVNNVMQGGTADMVNEMMIRSRAVCKRYGAKLVMNIHDELVFEAPDHNWRQFTLDLGEVLRTPPDPTWCAPIVLEFKAGKWFGSMWPVNMMPKASRTP